ncbi:hypothetical protein F5Y04DRAFT_63935 [Hypomontagnella monticulosa]|nr:hypothetical protein F5Y04DRAFT_63935 [Hypomontagnella monticulosa]
MLPAQLSNLFITLSQLLLSFFSDCVFPTLNPVPHKPYVIILFFLFCQRGSLQKGVLQLFLLVAGFVYHCISSSRFFSLQIPVGICIFPHSLRPLSFQKFLFVPLVAYLVRHFVVCLWLESAAPNEP